MPQHANSTDYVPDKQWEMLQLKTVRHEKHYSCCDNMFVDIDIKMKLRRNANSFTVNIVVPSAVLSGLTLLSFLLPPESGERMCLCITVLLSVTVFQQLTAQLMPRFQVPYLAQYYFITIIVVSLSLVANTLILNMFFRNTRRVPTWIRRVVIELLGPAMFCCRKKKGQETTRAISKSGAYKVSLDAVIENGIALSNVNVSPIGETAAYSDLQEELLEQRRKDWMKVVRILDRLCFIVFFFIFLVTLCAVFLQAPRFHEKPIGE